MKVISYTQLVIKENGKQIQKGMNFAILNDWEENQLRKKRTKICMCCDHFRYACTVQCVTLLTCPVHQKLIPQGDHLIKGCKYWVKRRELREGWCPEVA